MSRTCSCHPGPDWLQYVFHGIEGAGMAIFATHLFGFQNKELVCLKEIPELQPMSCLVLYIPIIFPGSAILRQHMFFGSNTHLIIPPFYFERMNSCSSNSLKPPVFIRRRQSCSRTVDSDQNPVANKKRPRWSAVATGLPCCLKTPFFQLLPTNGSSSWNQFLPGLGEHVRTGSEIWQISWSRSFWSKPGGG